MIDLLSISTILNFLVGTIRFIILLGILIFVHELGHFIAAKLSNVYVVRFSLGFGWRLFGFKIGETDYCVSAIPVGGYVKMVGQEDLPRSEEEARMAEPDLPDVPPERRFNTQPTGNKLAISFAGPFMNLIFALPVFWLVFMVGIQVPIFARLTWIGGVSEDSPAARAGIEPGQRIISINGDPVEKWEDVQLTILTNENEPLDMELKDLSGETTHVTVVPAREGDSKRASIGIEPLSALAIQKIVPAMPAEESGLRAGDIILSYGDKQTTNEEMARLIDTIHENPGSPVRLTVLRDERIVDLSVVPKEVSVIDGVMFDRNVVVGVNDEQVAPAAAALEPGDVVTAIDGIPLKSDDVVEWLAERIYPHSGDAATLAVERPRGLFAEPQQLTVNVPLSSKGMMGVVFSAMVTERFGPLRAMSRSIDAFGNSFVLTMKTIYYLVSGRVSTQEMAGPIGIAVMTEVSSKFGIGYYLNFVAFITINLAIINLLPIPVLDGGMILITLIESVRRKPIEEKYYIWLTWAGLFFIIFIVLMATLNDIPRAINFFRGGNFFE